MQQKKNNAYPRHHSKILHGFRWAILFLLIFLAGLVYSGCTRYVTQYPNPNAPLVFPKDHGPHDRDAHWEWWYFNGRLESESGNQYDYFWSFFKVFVENDTILGIPAQWMTWPFPMYLPFHFGGFSIYDHQNKKYERTYKSILPFFWNGGYQKSDFNVWLGKNKAWRQVDNSFRVQSYVDGYQLDLTLVPERQPLQYGKQKNGTLLHPDTIQKYYNITRLKTEGTVKKGKRVEKVTGYSWFDHQYGMIYNDDLQGYEWLSITLNNGVDIVVGLVHYLKMPVLPQSFCSIMFPDGRTEYMEMEEGNFRMKPIRKWKSQLTGTTYGIDWEVEIPAYDVKLTVRALKQKQEMITIIPPIAFWEGPGEARGTFQGKEVHGRSFLETWGDFKVPFRFIYGSKMKVPK